jgi:hypothetical protein
VPSQLFGYGRSDRSSKLNCGLGTETTAGFRSRQGCGHDPTPVASHNALFPSYKRQEFIALAAQDSRASPIRPWLLFSR